MKLNILYEDNHLLVVNKPSGILTQGDKTEDIVITDPYKMYLKDKYEKAGNVFLQPAHRLDRPVSGCIILTRTSKATTRITTAFREDRVRKTYLMISDKKTPAPKGHLVHYLIKDAHHNKVRAHLTPKTNSKEAILDYELLAEASGKCLYAIKPKTGRSHQIRVQMAVAGAPIIGDVKYGGMKHDDHRSILLHCHKMVFDHPTKAEPMQVNSLPELVGDWKLFTKVLQKIKG